MAGSLDPEPKSYGIHLVEGREQHNRTIWGHRQMGRRQEAGPPLPLLRHPAEGAAMAWLLILDIQDISELFANPRESGGWSKATQQGPTVDCCLVFLGWGTPP